MRSLGVVRAKLGTVKQGQAKLGGDSKFIAERFQSQVEIGTSKYMDESKINLAGLGADQGAGRLGEGNQGK